MPKMSQARPQQLQLQKLEFPQEPPLFRRSQITAAQNQQLNIFKQTLISSETSLGPFKAGTVNVNALRDLLGESPFENEKKIIVEALTEATAHSPPWLNGPPPASNSFSFRTPDLFPPEEASAIDKDIEEGLSNGTYEKVDEPMVATCLARRPVWQQSKYRIIDNARPVNAHMDQDQCSVAYEDLRWARAVAGPFMSKIDLKKGYRQLRLSDEAKPYFCFAWRGQLFRFNVMAFGDASAPKGFTKFMKIFALRWRKMGIICIIYLDDILVSASTFEKWLWSMKTILRDLSSASVRIGFDKLFLGPFECLEFLGVFIDYKNSSFFISPPRLQKLSGCCKKILQQQNPVQVKELQALLGLLSFFGAAYSGLSLFRRALDLAVAAAAEDSELTLSEEGLQELVFWKDALPNWSQKQFHFLPFCDMTIVTDASETAWGGMLIRKGAIILAAWEPLPDEMLGSASIARELWGLLSFFKMCLSENLLPSHCRVQVQMDNMGAGVLVTKSKAKTPDTLIIMRQMLQLQEASETHLVVDWRQRDDSLISLVDQLSKMPPGKKIRDIAMNATLLPQDAPSRNLGKAEWALDRKLFLDLCRWAWGPSQLPEVDLFATERNAQVETFCSRYFSPNSLGNAYSVDWSSKRLYAFPPFSQIHECAIKIANSKNSSLLFVTKFDRASPYWPILLSLKPIKKLEIRKEKAFLSIDGRQANHPPFDLVAFLFE